MATPNQTNTKISKRDKFLIDADNIPSSNVQHLSRINAYLTKAASNSKSFEALSSYLNKTSQEIQTQNNRLIKINGFISGTDNSENCLACGNLWKPGSFALRTKRKPRLTRKMKQLLKAERTKDLSRGDRKRIHHLRTSKNKFVLTCLKCKTRSIFLGSKKRTIEGAKYETSTPINNKLESILKRAKLFPPKPQEKKNIKIIRPGSKFKMTQVVDAHPKEGWLQNASFSSQNTSFSSPNVSFTSQGTSLSSPNMSFSSQKSQFPTPNTSFSSQKSPFPTPNTSFSSPAAQFPSQETSADLNLNISTLNASISSLNSTISNLTATLNTETLTSEPLTGGPRIGKKMCKPNYLLKKVLSNHAQKSSSKPSLAQFLTSLPP